MPTIPRVESSAQNASSLYARPPAGLRRGGGDDEPLSGLGERLAVNSLRFAVLVALILIVGMVIDHHSVTISVLAGVSFFSLFGIATLLILSGALARIITSRHHHGTIRRRHRYAYELARLPTVQSAPLLPPPPPLRLAAPEPLTAFPTFVPASDEPPGHDEAARWLLALYGADGQPDPAKVNLSERNERPGRIKIKNPSKEALHILLDLHLLHDLGNGTRLNLARFPTSDLARQRLNSTMATATRQE